MIALTLRASAAERPHRVDTLMGAAALLQTLVHILALGSVQSLISGMAGAVRSAVGVDARVLADQGVVRALVHILARLPVGSQGPALRTETEHLEMDTKIFLEWSLCRLA
jgi:hypothetical protein